MPRKNKQSSTTPGLQRFVREVMQVFQDHPTTTFNYKQVAKRLNVEEKTVKESLAAVLDQLAASGELIEIDRGKYKLKPVYAYVEGILDITSSGAAFLMSDDFEDDIYIAPRNVKH